MERHVLVFPVKPGQSHDQVASIGKMMYDRPDEYRDSRSRGAVTMERVYLQPTPMGDLVVAYLESSGAMSDSFMTLAQSDVAIDKDFVAKVNDIHGVDLTQPPQGSPPETVGEWTDPDMKGRGKGRAFCAPLIPGKEDAGRAFAKEAFVTRKDEFTASRRALGGVVEVVTLNETPMGPIIAVYVEGDDPEASNVKFAESQSPFDVWFKEQLSMLFPPEIDFNKPVPPVTEIFDSATIPG